MSTILIVDDDVTVLELLRVSVNLMNYTPIVTQDPTETFQILEKHSIDLTLLDIYMPDTDGVTLLQQIKSHHAYKNIPVIMMTASGKEELLPKCFELGATDFITKPVKTIVLKSRIQSALSTKKYIRQLADLNQNLEKKVEERTMELQKSEQRWRNLVETTNDWVWEVDENAVYTYTSPKILDILGYSPNEILGKSPFDLMSGDEAERVKRIFGPIAAYRKPFTCLENYNLHKDGHPVVLETSGVPFFNSDGKFLGYRGIDRDITERKQAEEALAESEKRLQSILDNTTAVVYLKDIQGRYVLINCRYETLFHIKKNEIEGKTDYDIFPKEMADDLHANDQKVLESRAPLEFEETVPQDGGIHTYISIKFPIFDSTGTPCAVCGISTDITHRKLAEEKERYQQDQLAQADKLISLGTLVAGVAHEINNPNNNIILNLPGIKKVWEGARPFIQKSVEVEIEKSIGGMPLEKAMEIFEKKFTLIEKGADRIEKIVNGLKDYARADISGYEKEVDVEAVIKTAVKFVEALVKKSTQRFKTNINPLPMVKGNFRKLEQVFINLLINACQALTDSNQSIEITGEYDDSEGVVIIKIRDEGKGMEKETMKKIMEPFYTTRQKSGGTGLGVSIAYGIVSDHNGSLDYDSTPGKGTTAKISLPVTKK